MCLFPNAADAADDQNNDIIQIFDLETGERKTVDGTTFALDSVPYRYLFYPTGSIGGVSSRTGLDQKFMYSIASDDKRTVICNRMQLANLTQTGSAPKKWNDTREENYFEWAPREV